MSKKQSTKPRKNPHDGSTTEERRQRTAAAREAAKTASRIDPEASMVQVSVLVALPAHLAQWLKKQPNKSAAIRELLQKQWLSEQPMPTTTGDRSKPIARGSGG
jgi:hypothetical protein